MTILSALSTIRSMRPSELDIKTGDTVSWWSGKKTGNYYILVSKEGLFPTKKWLTVYLTAIPLMTRNLPFHCKRCPDNERYNQR